MVAMRVPTSTVTVSFSGSSTMSPNLISTGSLRGEGEWIGQGDLGGHTLTGPLIRRHCRQKHKLATGRKAQTQVLYGWLVQVFAVPHGCRSGGCM